MLQEIADPDTRPQRRLEIGDRLAELRDPRPGVGLGTDGFPNVDWVEIPAGEFLYGEENETRFEDTFWIARYPITNVQYSVFIDSGGYAEKRWWEGMAKRVEAPEPSTWPEPNRPRTNVSWNEALAYCRWLSAQLGIDITLPTETQWEKAARGSDGREYPWGDGYRAGHANVDETGNRDGPSYLEQTTGVGLYPQGASLYGVLDLAGNVWDWCLNEYENPENTGPGGAEARVLRGGSWLVGPESSRADIRDGWSPGSSDWYGQFGFRLCCSSPISGGPRDR